MTEAGWTRQAKAVIEDIQSGGYPSSSAPLLIAKALADSYQQGRVAGLQQVITRMESALPLYGNDEWRERNEVESWMQWIKGERQQAQDEKGVGDANG